MALIFWLRGQLNKDIIKLWTKFSEPQNNIIQLYNE
jgi:hypothetical protein